MPLHIVTETYDEYNHRRGKEIYFFFKFLWYLVVAFLLSTFTKLINPADQNLQNNTLVVLFIIFMYAEFISKNRIKSYVKTFLGVLYLAAGLFTLYAFFAVPSLKDSTIILVFAGIFLYAAYRDISKYTNFIPFITHKFSSLMTPSRSYSTESHEYTTRHRRSGNSDDKGYFESNFNYKNRKNPVRNKSWD